MTESWVWSSAGNYTLSTASTSTASFSNASTTWQTTTSTGWIDQFTVPVTRGWWQQQPLAAARRPDAAARDAAAREQRLRDAADRRAHTLLHRHLNREQQADYRRGRWFDVVAGSGRRYRICHGVAGNVQLIEAGRTVATFCIHPTGDFPVEDVMLTQKILLEADEPAFLRTANETRLQAAA